MSKHRVIRSANGRQWDVVTSSGVIVEGGFFSKTAAMDSCAGWNCPVLDAEAARAKAQPHNQHLT
jgi:hypothetical protein